MVYKQYIVLEIKSTILNLIKDRDYVGYDLIREVYSFHELPVSFIRDIIREMEIEKAIAKSESGIYSKIV